MVDNCDMSFRNPNILCVAATVDDHRRAGRMRVRNLKASHGRTVGLVADLSGTGARLRLTARPGFQVGDETMVTLTSGTVSVALRVSVVWLNEVSRKEWEVGVKFGQLNPSESAAVQHLARMSRDALREEMRGR